MYQDIINSLDFDKQSDKMDKNNRLLSVVKAFSELDIILYALVEISQADIRNPLRYLLVSEGACTPPDTSKSPPLLIAFRN